MKNLLKEYIKNLIKLQLNEAAISLSSLTDETILVYIKKSDVNESLILINSNLLEEFLKRFDELDKLTIENFDDFVTRTYLNNDLILGFIIYGKNRSISSGECYGAKEVYLSVAKKGYGPLMYDLALSKAGKLMADRSEVSRKATKVWDYYFNHRQDVEHFKIDDYKNPKTPEKFDDGEVYRYPENFPTNYVYQFKNDTINADEKIEEGKQKIIELSKKYNITTTKIYNSIYFFGNELFNISYSC